MFYSWENRKSNFDFTLSSGNQGESSKLYIAEGLFYACHGRNNVQVHA